MLFSVVYCLLVVLLNMIKAILEAVEDKSVGSWVNHTV